MSLELVLLQELGEQFEHLVLLFNLYLVLDSFERVYDDKAIVCICFLCLLEYVVIYHDLKYVLDGQIVRGLEFNNGSLFGLRIHYYEVNVADYVPIVHFLLVDYQLILKSLRELV